MVRTNLGLRLRDKLGPDASQDLSLAFEEAQHQMVTITTERFEARLARAERSIDEEMCDQCRDDRDVEFAVLRLLRRTRPGRRACGVGGRRRGGPAAGDASDS